MNRNLCFLIVAGWGLSFIAGADELVAQTKYADVCRAEVNSSSEDSPEWFLAQLKLVNALCETDLRLALQAAQNSLRLADEQGSDAVVVARLYVSTIEGLLDSRSSVDTIMTQSDFELSSDASPELRLHFYLTLIDREVGSRNSETRVKSLLKRLCRFAQIAAGECHDPHLKLRQEAQELFVRSVWLSELQTSPRVMELRKNLVGQSEEFPFLVNSVVIDLADGTDENAKNGVTGQIASLKKSRFVALKSGLRRGAAIASYHLGKLFEAHGKFDEASVHYATFLRESKELGAQPFIYLGFQRLAKLERRRGNSELALELLGQAEKSPAFHDQSFLNQNYLYQDILSIHRHLKNESQVTKYKKKVLSRSRIKELKLSQKKSETLERLLTSIVDRSNEDLERLKEDHRIAESDAKSRIATLRMYLLVASTVCLLLASWFVYRARLSTVSNELDSKKALVRQSEQERDELAMRLNRIQRMESLGLMAGSVAHDFNNILVGVLGNAEVIQMQHDLQDVSFVRQRVDSIITSAEKAASLSRQMLAYAGKQYIAKQSTELNRLVLQYEPVLRSACFSNQCLDIQLGSSEILSKVDRTQIEQVLLNLVTNAVQASPEAGRITIKSGMESIADVDQDSALFGTRTTGGDFCFVEVSDEGQGIAPQDLDRIFEPFYSNSEIGRGLGLSVVYGVVKGHEGFIRCRTEIGKGTTFRVLLPVSVDKAAPSEVGNNLGEFEDLQCQTDAGSTTRTVLVVDDEEPVLDLCKQLLQLKGWNVLTATGGTHGLVQAVEFAEEISCILLDVVMPEMGANEVLQEIEDRGIEIPVILMSGFSQTKLEFFLERPNVVAIIEKPFHAIDIQRAVKAAVAQFEMQPKPTVVADAFVGFEESSR